MRVLFDDKPRVAVSGRTATDGAQSKAPVPPPPAEDLDFYEDDFYDDSSEGAPAPPTSLHPINIHVTVLLVADWTNPS